MTVFFHLVVVITSPVFTTNAVDLLIARTGLPKTYHQRLITSGAGSSVGNVRGMGLSAKPSSSPSPNACSSSSATSADMLRRYNIITQTATSLDNHLTPSASARSSFDFIFIVRTRQFSWYPAAVSFLKHVSKLSSSQPVSLRSVYALDDLARRHQIRQT